MTGFMTKTNAGPIPLQKPATPSLESMLWIVSVTPSFLLLAVGVESSGSEPRIACDVWTTHMGLLMIVVADPVSQQQTFSVHSQVRLDIPSTCNKASQHGFQGAQCLWSRSEIQNNSSRAFIEVVINTGIEQVSMHSTTIESTVKHTRSSLLFPLSLG